MGIRPSSSQEGERMEEEKHNIVHTILHPSATFHITPSMLHLDEILG
jgi:hypothetical protein